MHEPDFWTQCAEAMEQTIEGRRLIANELADLASRAWHTVSHKLESAIHGLDNRPHLPPV
ncbi:MAG: hypothetical protein U1E70_27445 [Acetobacteraceae bacterium]|nr:hypothetical protein [Pseudomonadota bacterium]